MQVVYYEVSSPSEGSMSTGSHRLAVVVCALAWFLVGMHSPVVHEVVDHGMLPGWSVLALFTLFVVAGVASLWALLRLRGAPAA